MATTVLDPVTQVGIAADRPPSAVSWGAILAGGAGAAAMSVVLLILGTGLGFTVISPWSHEGVSATSSMLVGAFVASLMATYGGRLRDE